MARDRWMTELFANTPRARRRLYLLLYTAVGPLFTLLLYLAERDRGPPTGTGIAAALLVAGAAWLSLCPCRDHGALEWIVPVALVPIACCGIAFAVTGGAGVGFLAVMGAPIAWCAILFEGTVAWAALGAALATCFVAVAHRSGPLVAAGNTLLFGTVFGLVALVVFHAAEGLRAARAAALRTTERDRFLSALFGTMEDAVLVLDPELRIVEYIGRAREIYGWEPEEARGRRLTAEFTSEFPDGDRERAMAELAAGKPVRARIRALRKDGSWADLDLSATALRDAAGRVTGYLSVSREIGAQVAAERALREALQNVKTLSGLLPICMYCKRVRDDEGYWEQVESYVHRHTDAQFSHGMCPECEKKHFPEE
jgi:PAS domain S-box-containing protein